MSKNMNAYGFGDPGEQKEMIPFEKREISKPEPNGRQLLVEVKAVGLNPTDVMTWKMKKTDDESFTVLGRDVSGVVVEIGEATELFEIGDEVFYPGTSNVQGAQADFHLIDERMVAKKPTNLDFAEAAALPLTALTAYETFFDQLQIPKNAEKPATLLIVGAAGGVGSIATQIALNNGIEVIGTASRDESRQQLKSLGVKKIIDHSKPYGEQLNELGYDAVPYVFLAANADDNIKEVSKIVSPRGHVCSILPLSQPLPKTFFGKSISFSYELMYTRSVYQTADWIRQHEYLDDLRQQVEAGNVKTTINHRYEEMNGKTLSEAYKQLMTGHTTGKIVLEHKN
ncbi:zinc-binding alcohol dehydrogenase family protein [Marinilactibacillus kalidii]|uniref:zinc-binding alcohol dehydrogenase family protein n=1 Tax=Marinilactibacillus kalidii TaxID=2820274 RepID=UPI001ABE334F|nr:zinc-binding alcohol dehydrogenase family protein [Marinilactibacillus kalidii]